MNENSKFGITITEESIHKVNLIISEMEGKTFHNHYHIIYDLCTSLKKNNIIYLEIGTFAGGSASLISSHKDVEKVISVDIGHPIDMKIPIKNVNKFKNQNCVYDYIKGDSNNEQIINLVYDNHKSVDILFIDGDHTYKSVIQDFNNYKNIVNQNGYIVFDDYLDPIHSPDVFHAVNDIVKSLSTKEYQVIGSLKYDLISKTNSPNQPSSNEYIIKKLI